MKKALLIAALLPLGCQTQLNSANCVVGPACGPGLFCDSVSETCQPVSLTLTNIEPKYGSQRAATTVTITGTGFQEGITVQVNGVPATPVSVLSPTQLTALVPPSATRCGPVNVHLSNPDNTVADRADIGTVHALVAATGVFNSEEIDIAAELVEQRCEQGPASDYEFCFAEHAGELAGYSCYGRIPFTTRRFDLYWIAVHPKHQGAAL